MLRVSPKTTKQPQLKRTMMISRTGMVMTIALTALLISQLTPRHLQGLVPNASHSLIGS